MGLTPGQQKCVDTLDKPLVVAAGAGSGKTFTLTKRIVEALRDGNVVSDIGEVCAITFTKKAAAELKSRIKGELRACGLIDQALKVDEAWISTIHGMCARILRAHAIELGIDPAFEVAEGVVVDEYLAQAVDAVLVEAAESRVAAYGDEVPTSSASRAAAQDTAAIDALFDAYRARSGEGFGTSVESMLVELVAKASAQVDGVESFVLPGLVEEPRVIVYQALEVAEALLAKAAEQKEGVKRDDWIAATEAQVQVIRAAFEAGVSSHEEAFGLVAPLKLAKTFGSREYKSQVDEARGVFGALVMEARLGIARGHLTTLVGLAGRALELFAQMKRDAGVLDNNDLLVMAARALEEHPAIAERYSDKFKLVMVDEFQDTDQMQVDMIKRLAGAGAQRLCTVGDAQQSIYRFRGADVSVYRRHLESVGSEQPDSIVQLADNFRSHADVLSFVDCVFQKPGMFGGEFMSLAHGRDEEKVTAPFGKDMPRIRVQHTSVPWRGVGSDRLTDTAARRIAREFAELARAGHSAGEMVVLLGRMTYAGVYARALRDEGLPCVISGGSVFARTMEAKVARELVRVIANPHETEALFNVLTSPVFGLSAGDLLATGGLEGFWRAAGDGGAGLDSPSPQLACALRVMGAMRRAAGETPVSRIVETVAVDSGWLSRLERDGAEGLASAGNVFKAIRMIRNVERAGATGPASVMRRFGDELDGSKEAPGALSVSGGNSVRIMTIHASKGLEFPIVAVAEVKEDRAPHARLLAASIDGKVYLSLDTNAAAGDGGGKVDMDAVRAYVLGDIAGEDDLACAVQEEAGALHRRLALGEYIAEGDAEEAKRLLYVALTRAREAIVVASTGKRTKANPLGVPKSALAGVFDALGSSGAAFEEGVSRVEFGGSMPAVVECVALSADDASCEAANCDGREEAGDAADAEGESNSSHAARFMIPAAESAVVPAHEAWRPLRDGMFSYSSISDASHEGDVLDRLSHAYAVSVDEGARAEPDESGGVPQTLQPLASLPVFGGGEDDFWDVDPSQAFDEDRATDLGTAFHRLAQYAVVTRADAAGLALPSQERIDALARTCNLDSLQRDRLNRALDRWFGCNLAREMAALPHLDAEVPFCVSVSGAYLEGEIDLLGFDGRGSNAFVVDYKTGGGEGETTDDLRRKHVLQAACYAYAILLQGVERVDATFVRVERPRAGESGQPQCVRYRFSAADLPALREAIAGVYAVATG